MYTCECGAVFETYNKRNSHMAHCKVHLDIKYDGNIPKRTKINRTHTEGYYRCECGREFFNQNQWCGHASNCKVHLGEERYLEIKQIRRNTRIQTNINWSHSRTSESYKKQSATRKLKYKEGTLKPANGVGRGKYSYMHYKGNLYMLRSTYEFIFCLYLCYLDLPINLEDTRVQAVKSNRWSNTFLSDFRIGNTIIEIKGIPSGKDNIVKESFEASGYTFTILYENSINKIKQYLEKVGFDINQLIANIQQGHDTKQYFVYNFPLKLS